jgi:hypothetical protein
MFVAVRGELEGSTRSNTEKLLTIMSQLSSKEPVHLLVRSIIVRFEDCHRIRNWVTQSDTEYEPECNLSAISAN